MSQNLKQLKWLITIVLILASALPYNSQNEPVYCFNYPVELTGEIKDKSFDLEGHLMLIATTAPTSTLNDVNLFEFWISAGSPALQGEPGAITFVSNTGFYIPGSARQAAIDAVFMDIDLDNYTFTAESDIEPMGELMVNVFSATSFEIYKIGEGSIEFSFEDNTAANISGSIAFEGSGFDPSFKAVYTANFEGEFSEITYECNLPGI